MCEGVTCLFKRHALILDHQSYTMFEIGVKVFQFWLLLVLYFAENARKGGIKIFHFFSFSLFLFTYETSLGYSNEVTDIFNYAFRRVLH